MDFKLFGGVLLIIGVSVGGGILALPIATVPGGFWPTCGLLLLCWSVMTAGAFLLLEVNLALPDGSNLISMAKATLGLPGQVLAWGSYLLLLYALLSAYIAGGTDVINGLFQSINLKLPLWVDSILFVLIFGYVVYHGVKSVDYLNRGLMTGKLALYLLLLASLSWFVDLHDLPLGTLPGLLPGMTVVITSFGYAIILPSLRTYFNGDVKMLRRAIFIGSLIPLLLYVVWVAMVQDVLALEGEHGLLAIGRSAAPVTALSDAIVALTQSTVVSIAIHLFASICMLTSFLGVSLSLSDFLSDGLAIKKEGVGRIKIALATFIPSLLIIIFYPAIFIKALSYAGIFCVILLMLLPVLMAWSARYRKKLISSYHLFGGAFLLSILIAVSVVFLAVGAYVSVY